MIRAAVLTISLATLAGCQALAGIFSVVSYNVEAQKKIEVLAKYNGLENKTVVILVDLDMSSMYEHPSAVSTLMGNIARQIQLNVAGVRVLDPLAAITWQHHHPSWPSMPLSELMKELDVQRVVIVDVIEYRLNPPGNRWIWEGVATANVGVAEEDGADPDAHAEELSATAKFPMMEHLGRDGATERDIELGLQKAFVEEVAWLFYDHIEDKYPELAK
ncbi:MAG: hypothetical protein EXS00_01150 [Phycisphaerales bacterium]|nr:hypothetical protein [Phycisphaerales bacterium]